MFPLVEKKGAMVAPRRGVLLFDILKQLQSCPVVDMAHTRGGSGKAVAPPRVYTTPTGIKVRKLNGKTIFQPASLKMSCYLTLDRHYDKKGLPRRKLYENVQKFLDLVVDQVEDRILRIDCTGMIDWF